MALQLLRRGANPNIVSVHDYPNMWSDDFYYYSPLDEATKRGEASLCKMLVAKGAKKYTK